MPADVTCICERDRLGSVAVGKLADLVGYPVDPTLAEAADLGGGT